MASGDIQSKDPFSTIGNGMSSIANGIGDVVGLFRGSSSSNNSNQNVNISTTTEEDVSEEKARAYLEKLLSGTDGLAAITSGQKSAGIYDSTTNQMLVNDLLGSVVSNVAALSKKTTQTQSGTISNSTTQKKKGALEWIVCTELHEQGRIPHDFYRKGAKKFATYSDKTKQGYYYWAVGAVKHLRKYPNSRFSNFLAHVFYNRAEYVAAQMGCKRAKKTLFGFVVTYGTYALCVALSRTVARKPIDWYSAVYKGA
jgi:hypothetical protein